MLLICLFMPDTLSLNSTPFIALDNLVVTAQAKIMMKNEATMQY